VSERRTFVLEARIGRAIISLSWPIALSNELGVLTGSLTLFWLGRLVGDTGLVIDALFAPLAFLVGCCFGLTCSGASVLVSRSVGANDRRGMSITAGALTLLLVLWLVCMAIAAPATQWIAGALTGDLGISAPMSRYFLGFLLFALPASMAGSLLMEVVNGTGATKFNLVRIVIDLAALALLTPVLIGVLGLGLVGAQIAAGIAPLGLSVVLWSALVRRRDKLALGELQRGDWGVRWSLWREIVGIGLPMQMGRIAMYLAQLVLIRLVVRDGAASVAGYGIACLFIFFGAMATLGFARGTGIVVGQALGAGLNDRAARAVPIGLIIGLCIALVYVGLTCFARPLIELFSSSPAIVDAAEHALGIMRWGLLAGGSWQVMLSCFAAHRATVRAGLLMIVGEACGLVVALMWRGSFLDAVSAAFIVANVTKAGLLGALLATGVLAKARAVRRQA
jgi:Na+-driven multidrug efflux pump